MIKTSKVKYLGIAAAALLAVAPAAVTAVAPAFTGANVSTVQAATKANVTSKFNLDGIVTLNVKDRAQYYSDQALTKTTTTQKGAQDLKIDAVYFSGSTIKSLHIQGGNNWVAFDDVDSSTSNLELKIGKGDKDTLPLQTANAKTVWTATDGSKVTTGAGVAVTPDSIRTDNGALTSVNTTSNGIAYTIKGSDVTTDASSLNNTEDTNVGNITVTPKYVSGAQIYSDNALSDAVDGSTLAYGKTIAITAIVKNSAGSVVGYKIGDDQYVAVGDITENATSLTKVYQNGKVTTKNAATPYFYVATPTADGGSINVLAPQSGKVGKNQALNYTVVLQNANGDTYAYGYKDTSINDGTTGDAAKASDGLVYILASDVKTTAPSTDLTITVVPAGTLQVDSKNAAVKVYSDAATTQDSGAKLDTQYNIWDVTRTAKDKDGKTVAYDLGNSQWVKAADVSAVAASKVTVSPATKGQAVYSNFKGATIYSDADTTKANGTLNTSYDEWSTFQVAKDADGNIVAYDLGSNQWVKASDLSLIKTQGGTFDANAGTALYNRDGDVTGSIQSDGLYQIFAVTYINGKQSLKLGNDNQWIIASTGDYYPA
ncbi:MAG: hypothetical protein LKF36_10430 [Lactobacillus sp.]|jgi:hypothetical protein|nr:hypothetical protein [Lactobacillus sp.]